MKNENINILIADDDESIRTTLEFILLEQKFKVVSAGNGKKALEEINKCSFNIAVLDYKLPDIDGIELASRIKEVNDDVEVIILTGRATLESAIKAVKEDVYEYLTKPVDPVKLIEVINSALEKQHLVVENKRLFWELKKSNKELERINKFKDGLISMISHDLRSPISSLQGFNYSLLNGYAGELTQQQKEVIETENGAIEIMMDLINNLLDIRQIEAGELRMRKITANIEKTVIMPVIQRLTPQLNEKKIEVSVACENDIPEVYIDVARISQVLQNLMQNAIKFTPQTGRICVSISIVPDDQIVLKVSDSGAGIPKESLNSIFEAFYTTENNDSKDKVDRSKIGRGLGLSICKEIIRAHNGVIWAESEGVGKGSSFIVMLPVKSADLENFSAENADISGS